MITNDIQYGATAAALFDPLISSALPADALIERCADHVTGHDVVDVGIGTGRVAIPLARLARTVTGVDNSPEMLARLLAKELPANLTAELADVREALPGGPYTAAISTMGSISYVADTDELVTALRNVHRVLAPRGRLVVETYSRETYSALSQLGPVTVPSPAHPSTCTLESSLHGDLLTVATRVDHADGGTESFSERVLALPQGVFEDAADAAGFDTIEADYAADFAPFDWFVVERR